MFQDQDFDNTKIPRPRLRFKTKTRWTVTGNWYKSLHSI